jgi:helicase
MESKIVRIKNSSNVLGDLSRLLERLHIEGPIDSDFLEDVALYKEFHPKSFELIEGRVISAMGLFYKVDEPNDLYSLMMSTVGDYHKERYGKALTPVQASVRRAVDDNQFVSISAPTSAGKSYSIRDFIAEQKGDAVVIVPSRALIAEYISSMRQGFEGVKDVMVSPFVDDVFKKRNLRHIFVLTPERARELFLRSVDVNISVFFFDEAQMSEEKGRGVIFDVLVRRVRKRFPSAKIIFAHPFVDNPEAQLKKHQISEDQSYARSYTHGTVGKIAIYQHKNGRDLYFSPFVEKGHLLTNCVEFEGGFANFAFNGNHSILIFVSKASIYDGKFLMPFQSYVDNFPAVDDADALEIIRAVEHALGADQSDHRSKLVALLKKGVVIHHGSVPLEVRFLVEDFIRKKFARICFATNTLAQGVNMPFDIVWLHNMRVNGDESDDKSLSFKNLTGRAGRLSQDHKFDYGYVFTKNPELYTDRVNDTYHLSETSVIDLEHDGEADDVRELIDSIRDGSFDDQFNLPKSRIDRLARKNVLEACGRVLDLIYAKKTIRESIEGDSLRSIRETIKNDLKTVFEEAINRKLLPGEESVFRQGITIFLLAIGGRTFREIAGIRYSLISRRNEGRKGTAEFSQPAESLPNSKLKNKYSLFADVLARDVSYDAVVFDTYDYMDKVVSFSLSDVFIAAFKIYGETTMDQRAEKMLELLRFGTNNVDHILLMRYGFPPESVGEIVPYIQFVSENEIQFLSTIDFAPRHIREMAEWYLP